MPFFPCSFSLFVKDIDYGIPDTFNITPRCFKAIEYLRMIGDAPGHDNKEQMFGIHRALEAGPSGKLGSICENPSDVDTQARKSPVRKCLKCIVIRFVFAFHAETFLNQRQIRNIII